jgi:D-alanyl-D-alanine dipeptidase
MSVVQRTWKRAFTTLLMAPVAMSILVTGCAAPTAAARWTAPTTTPSSAPATSAAPTTPPDASTAPPPTASAAASSTAHAPAGIVALSDVDATILQDIRYGTEHNFVGRQVAGYQEPLCILTRQAAEALHRAQTAARAHGYSLKVYDCYRPQQATDDFARWGQRLDEEAMKAEFYPQLDKSELFPNYIADSPTTHSRGSTVDLTLVALPPSAQRRYVSGEKLVSCAAPVGQRFGDNTVDMGTGFDCFDSLANTLDPRVTGPAMDNRLLLKQLMKDAGFTNYAKEWWHYQLAGEPFPKTYFDFPVSRAAVAGN